MNVRVVSGPAPIITPADVAGDHEANDARIAALIAAVQAGIDGPTGWLGRALGEQTLALTRTNFRRSFRLPFPPVTEIVDVNYRDEDDNEQTVDAANYRGSDDMLIFSPTFALPRTSCAPDAVTINYKAGYGSSAVPANARQAVVIGVQLLNALASEQNPFLRSEEVEGIGTFSYTVSEAAGLAVKAATETLLQPLRVYWL